MERKTTLRPIGPKAGSTGIMCGSRGHLGPKVDPKLATAEAEGEHGADASGGARDADETRLREAAGGPRPPPARPTSRLVARVTERHGASHNVWYAPVQGTEIIGRVR